MPQADISKTLTRSDLQAPFRQVEPDAEMLQGPTRTCCEVESTADAFVLRDIGPDGATVEVVRVEKKAKH